MSAAAMTHSAASTVFAAAAFAKSAFPVVLLGLGAVCRPFGRLSRSENTECSESDS
jgi:hypothetical protein